jgi:hypothetical protein
MKPREVVRDHLSIARLSPESMLTCSGNAHCPRPAEKDLGRLPAGFDRTSATQQFAKPMASLRALEAGYLRRGIRHRRREGGAKATHKAGTAPGDSVPNPRGSLAGTTQADQRVISEEKARPKGTLTVNETDLHIAEPRSEFGLPGPTRKGISIS